MAGEYFYPEQDQYGPDRPVKSGTVWLTFAHMSPVGVTPARNEYIIGAARKDRPAQVPPQSMVLWNQKGTKNKGREKFINYVLDPEDSVITACRWADC